MRVHRKAHSRDAIIHIRVRGNPKKDGSMARSRFALYREGMTVGEFLDAGGRRTDLWWDSERAFIDIIENFREAA